LCSSKRLIKILYRSGWLAMKSIPLAAGNGSVPTKLMSVRVNKEINLPKWGKSA
jgi:hypothetical protein